MNKYNGWTNYETWVVNLWIGNDEGSYRYWQERTDEAWAMTDDKRPNKFGNHKENAALKLGDWLKNEHQELVTARLRELGEFRYLFPPTTTPSLNASRRESGFRLHGSSGIRSRTI